MSFFDFKKQIFFRLIHILKSTNTLYYKGYIMHRELEELLLEIDRKINELSVREVQKEFEKIPLDIFGRIQINCPNEYSNILKWLPHMPSADIQKSWTGCSNHELMTQSLAFIKTIVSTYNFISTNPLNKGNILDFGCGWGRIIRLLYKYVPADRIYGVDPWEKSINICKETNIRGNLYLSDYLPRTLPTPNGVKFNFIMAFSVFTHLSPNATKICVQTIREYLTDNGVIAITIRPVEFWDHLLRNNKSPFNKDIVLNMLDNHDKKGIAFYPHNRKKIEGEITYGDTSISLEYIKHNFQGLKIISIEYNESDPLQLIVFLQNK